MNDKRLNRIFQEILDFCNSLQWRQNDPYKEAITIHNIRNLYNFILVSPPNRPKITISSPGNSEEVDIIQRSDLFIGNFFTILLPNISFQGLNDLISTSNNFISNKSVDNIHKLIVNDVENTFFSNPIYEFIRFGDDKTVESFVNLRLNLILEHIYNFDIIAQGEFINPNIESSYNAFDIALDRKIQHFIVKNQIFQALAYLKEELEINEDQFIQKKIVNKLIKLNSSYLLEPMTFYKELFDQYKTNFNEIELSILKLHLEPNENSGLLFTEIMTGEVSKRAIQDKDILTSIIFCIPFVPKNVKPARISIDDITEIEFNEVKDFSDDPIYKKHRPDINGIGWNFLSDSFNSKGGKSTGVVIHIKGNFNPDIELTDDSYKNVKPSDGSDHKEHVLKIFSDHFDKINDIIEIKRSDLNINLFSNFMVDVFDLELETVIFNRLFALTNPNALAKASQHYLERLAELNLEEESSVSIRELIEKTKITTERDLALFISQLIEILVKDDIELHGNYRYFWKEENGKLIPKNEPDMQPLIFTGLKTICDFMGIQISREVESANGKMDFLCSYTHEGKLFKTCIELKNAHSEKLEHGLTKQLPLYLKSQRTQQGIYVVLWYKGDSFKHPTKYNNIEELEADLVLKKSSKSINTIAINCSKPIQPSRIK